MIYGYIRVSTDHQTTLNQEFEITRFCRGKSMEISGWIQETISGTQAYDKRALGKLLRRVGKGDLIICTEISGNPEHVHEQGLPGVDGEGRLPPG